MRIKVVCRLGRQVSLYSSSQSPLSPSRLCPSPVLKSFSLRQHLPRGELVQPFHRAACASTSHLCNMRPVGLATPPRAFTWYQLTAWSSVVLLFSRPPHSDLMSSDQPLCLRAPALPPPPPVSSCSSLGAGSKASSSRLSRVLLLRSVVRTSCLLVCPLDRELVRGGAVSCSPWYPP